MTTLTLSWGSTQHMTVLRAQLPRCSPQTATPVAVRPRMTSIWRSIREGAVIEESDISYKRTWSRLVKYVSTPAYAKCCIMLAPCRVIDCTEGRI